MYTPTYSYHLLSSLYSLCKKAQKGGMFEVQRGNVQGTKGGMFEVQRGNVQGTGTPQKPSKIKAFRDRKKSNTY